MSFEEFGRLTLRQLQELADAWEGEQRRADLRAAQICVVMAEAHRSKTARPFEVWDFFPSLETLRPPPPSDEELERKMLAAFGL